jgi:hypothetical protein
VGIESPAALARTAAADTASKVEAPGMAKAKSGARSGNRRGSPEAIEKRRVARAFNDLMGGGGSAPKLDGRTEKRRQRLLRELEEGKAHGARELKPLDVLTRVNELLELGEQIATIRKARKLPRAIAADEGTVELVHRLHNAYGFRRETYRFVGISDEVLQEAGVIPGEGNRRGARRKKSAS